MELSTNLSGFTLAPNRRLHFFQEITQPDIALINELVDNHHAIFLYQNDLADWPTMHERLMGMVHLKALLVLEYTRGAFSSGLSSARIRRIIESDDRISGLIERIEWGFIIHSIWISCYTGLGEFKWHRDKNCVGGTHRIIFTLGAVTKVMRFKRNGEDSEVGVYMPHNSFVALSKVGGGVTTNEEGVTFKHMIDQGGNSWTVNLHASRRPGL